MWIKTSTQLSENVYQVTTPASSHFLIVGDDLALVDCGLAVFQQELIDEIRPFVAGGTPLKFLFLTHSHFDHIGALPYLRSFAPGLIVCGSPQTDELLKKRDLLRKSYDQQLDCARAVERTIDLPFEAWAEAIHLDRVVSEGDAVNIGDGVEIKVISTPGHTEDSLSYFVRPDSALAAGEAVGGYHGRDKVAPCFLSGYEEYVTSFEKFLGLDVKILGLPHTGALTADLAKKFLASGRAQAEAFVKLVREKRDAGAIREEIYFDLLNEWAVEGISPEGPFVEGQQEVLRTMIGQVMGESAAAEAP